MLKDRFLLNIGTGKDIPIKDLALLIKDIAGYEGELEFDIAKPDGIPKKVLDVSRLNSFGWVPKITLRSGVETVYKFFSEGDI